MSTGSLKTCLHCRMLVRFTAADAIGINPAAGLQGKHDPGCLGQYRLAQHKAQTCAEMRHRHIVSDAPENSSLLQSMSWKVAGACFLLEQHAVFRISRVSKPSLTPGEL